MSYARDLASLVSGGAISTAIDGIAGKVDIVGAAVDDWTWTDGTYTPDPDGGNLRRIVNGGAFTLAAPTASGDYSMTILVTNNASAGAITLSGFDADGGDSFTTTDGDSFFVHITKINGLSNAIVSALQ